MKLTPFKLAGILWFFSIITKVIYGNICYTAYISDPQPTNVYDQVQLIFIVFGIVVTLSGIFISRKAFQENNKKNILQRYGSYGCRRSSNLYYWTSPDFSH